MKDVTKKIEKLVTSLSSQEKQDELAIERRERLRKLTEKYGYDNVALAAGLSVGSLSMYLRSKRPSVSEKAVSQAEYVFRNIR